MTAYVRLFATEAAAQTAAVRLKDSGFDAQEVLLPSAVTGREEEAVRAIAEKGMVPGSQLAGCIDGLKRGQAIIAVEANFGHGYYALEIMDESGAMGPKALPPAIRNRAAPFSEFLGLPVLAHFTPATDLKDSNWTLTENFGGLLIDNPAPLSQAIGWGPLKPQKRPWIKSFGFKMQMKNPAPLSALFGMTTVTRKRKAWKTSLGFPLLIDSAAPLSKVLGLPVLSKRRA